MYECESTCMNITYVCACYIRRYERMYMVATSFTHIFMHTVAITVCMYILIDCMYVCMYVRTYMRMYICVNYVYRYCMAD